MQHCTNQRWILLSTACLSGRVINIWHVSHGKWCRNLHLFWCIIFQFHFCTNCLSHSLSLPLSLSPCLRVDNNRVKPKVNRLSGQMVHGNRKNFKSTDPKRERTKKIMSLTRQKPINYFIIIIIFNFHIAFVFFRFLFRHDTMALRSAPHKHSSWVLVIKICASLWEIAAVYCGNIVWIVENTFYSFCSVVVAAVFIFYFLRSKNRFQVRAKDILFGFNVDVLVILTAA